MIANGLSVDVEDWFQTYNYERIIPRDTWNACELRVEANTRRLLDILGRKGVRATFFVLGWIADRVPGLVRSVLEDGHEVATHGYSHRRLIDLNAESFREDLRRSLDSLNAAGATRVQGFRAPSFSLVRDTQWALDVLTEYGLEYDSSIFPTGAHQDYGISDAPLRLHRIRENLWEIPMTALEVLGRRLPVGGGGYFRHFPYSLTRFAMRRVNAEGRPVVFYLHPWELDPHQPRPAAPAWRIFRQTVGLGRTAERLERLLDDFKFVPLEEMLAAGRAEASELE